jgi:uncharacterized protein (TIGR00369 family)
MIQDVHDAFARQALMATLGATLERVVEGEVEIHLPFQTAHTQHTGVLHAGVVTSIADSACGFAAMSRLPEGRSIVSVEFKVNLLSPAVGDELRAVGRVVRAGRTITVCTGDVWVVAGEDRRHVAMMQATMMNVPAPA